MATSLIVGADRGIANALCLQLYERGENVIAACLGNSPALAAKGARVETGVDVTSDSAVQALAQRLSGTHVDGAYPCGRDLPGRQPRSLTDCRRTTPD